MTSEVQIVINHVYCEHDNRLNYGARYGCCLFCEHLFREALEILSLEKYIRFRVAQKVIYFRCDKVSRISIVRDSISMQLPERSTKGKHIQVAVDSLDNLLSTSAISEFNRCVSYYVKRFSSARASPNNKISYLLNHNPLWRDHE